MDDAHQEPGDQIPCLRERFADLIQEFQRIARTLLLKLPAPSVASGDLVNEAYLKLVREETRRLGSNRSGFDTKSDAILKSCFGAACRDVMSVRWRKRERRREVRLDFEARGDGLSQFDLADIDELLRTLAVYKPELAQIVEARVFGGLTVRECSELFAVSPATVDRRWRLGRTWIRQELEAAVPP